MTTYRRAAGDLTFADLGKFVRVTNFDEYLAAPLVRVVHDQEAGVLLMVRVFHDELQLPLVSAGSVLRLTDTAGEDITEGAD